MIKKDFIRQEIAKDVSEGGRVATRFPPEPNGYLHIGHAKSICLNFLAAMENSGTCSLRFDDTNPRKEKKDFTEAIKTDVKWLGFDWEKDGLRFASDHFDTLFEFARFLTARNEAFVDDLSAQQIREYRGTLTQAGIHSPFRNRSGEESLKLLEGMKKGEFAEGEKVLRAKIDMSSGNINMRDPVIYRIIKIPHHKTGEKWKIYPTYDFAHPVSDAIENITHSLCTLEFEDHRPLYDWFVKRYCEFANGSQKQRPRQIEFSRLELSHTVMSKRRLSELVKTGAVKGWDDPRMPTISGMRRRGYPAEAIKIFCDRVGITKQKSVIEVKLLEHTVREYMNKTAPRRMAVLNPLKIIITNYPENKEEIVSAVNNPEDENAGERPVIFSRTLFIEREDFMENPTKKFHRLFPGAEVRLRYGYFVTCKEFRKNDKGEITFLLCEYDPETKGGNAPDGRKVKGTIHWVSAEKHAKAQVRLYDRLFNEKTPSATDSINPDSLRIVEDVPVEMSLTEAKAGEFFQFERKGYFTVDEDSDSEKIIFNRTETLRDSWKGE